MGRRLLKERLPHPLKEIQNIEKRYEAVEWGRNNYKDFEKYMTNVPDLTQLNRKMNLGRRMIHVILLDWISYVRIFKTTSALQDIEVPTIETQTKLVNLLSRTTHFLNR